MGTPYLKKRPGPYRDPNKGYAVTWTRRYDETDSYSIDISEKLNSGETCSSVTLVDTSGPTITGEAVTSAGVLSMTVSDGSGLTTAQVTTSDSRVIEIPLQWRSSNIPPKHDAYAE